MEKISINDLMIEVTRKCQLACEHCLRGCSEDMDINIDHINTLISELDSISSITFTGGEPSLNVEAIKQTLYACRMSNVSVGSFYIATNAIDINEDFIMACLQWFAYCDDKEMCRVDISNDYFHGMEGSYDTELLDGLSFVHRKYSQEGEDIEKYCINEGYFTDNFGYGRENYVVDKTDIDEIEDFEIYLNCEGNIILGCNWSYRSQREREEIIFSTVDDFANEYRKIMED